MKAEFQARNETDFCFQYSENVERASLDGKSRCTIVNLDLHFQL